MPNPTLNGPVVILDFKRKRVEMFAPGELEGQKQLEDALLSQLKLHPTASGIAPPQKSA
jgi:hypothetical protein